MKNQPTPRQIAEARYAEYNRFIELGFTPAEAAEWKSYGFLTRTAPMWRNAGFTAAEAKAWRDVSTDRTDPVLPAEAVSARNRGETPITYRRNRNRTYPHPMRTR